MIVEMHDHRRQQEPLLAALDGAAPNRAFEAVEEADQIFRRPLAAHVFCESIDPFVRGAEGARRTAANEVIAKRLIGPALRSRTNRRRQFLRSVMRVSHRDVPSSIRILRDAHA